MNVQAAYEEVKKFNTIAGVLTEPSYEQVDLYNSLGFEELAESITALENGDKVEILDGCLDEFFIICGKMQILEKMGYNVEEGLNRVCSNNLSKYMEPPNNQFAKDNNYNINVSVVPEFVEDKALSELNQMPKYEFWYYTDQNGKVKKPPNFVPVDLSDLVPEVV